MPDRSLIVRILGDASSLKNTYNEATRATKQFGNVQQQETEREEKNLLRLRTKRAQSLGPLRIAAAGLGAGAAVFAGIQGLRALADGLKVVGDEAFTTTGRIKNLAAELASGNIVGGLQALVSQESRIAPDLEKAVALLHQMGDEASRVSLKDVVGDTDKFHAAAAQATKDMVTIGIPIDDAKDKTAAWVEELKRAAGTTTDLGGTFETVFGRIHELLEETTKKAIAAREKGLDRLAELPPGIGAAIAREEGPEGSEEGLLKVLRQADANLAKRIDELRRDSGRDVSKKLEQLQRQRNSIFNQIQAILKPDKVQVPKVDTSAADALAAGVRAQREAFARVLDFLDIRLDRARASRGFQDDLRLLEELEAAVRAQMRVEGRTVELERRLLGIEQERVNIARQRKEIAQQQQQADQFRALGLTAQGDQQTPTIANLQKQLKSITERVADTNLDTPKTKGLLEKIRKVLTDPLDKATVETRAKIRELFATIREGFEEGASKGPLTKTTGLNTKKILEGLGLDAATENEIRSRLSGFNSAGRALAPSGATATTGGGRIGPGGPIIVESHTTIQLDSDVVARAVTRAQQKGRRRNPQQKRGPNRIGA